MNVLSDFIALWSCHISLAYKGQPSSCPYSCLICPPLSLFPPLSLSLLYDYAYDFSHISCHNTDPYRSDTATACSDHPATAAAAAGRFVTDFIDLSKLQWANEIQIRYFYQHRRVNRFPVKILQLSSFFRIFIFSYITVSCFLIGSSHLNFVNGTNPKRWKEISQWSMLWFV